MRSECLTCTFRASCCSARLSRAQVPALGFFTLFIEHIASRQVSEQLLLNASTNIPITPRFLRQGQDKKGGKGVKGWGGAFTGGYKGVRAVRPESVADGDRDIEAFTGSYENTCFAVFQGRKEMFYLTTRSTHFIYGYMASVYGKGPLR